jgi:hypothetical protein
LGDFVVFDQPLRNGRDCPLCVEKLDFSTKIRPERLWLAKLHRTVDHIDAWREMPGALGWPRPTA